jgi:hypothetical protein
MSGDDRMDSLLECIMPGGAWVPSAISHHDQCLGPMLPETRNDRCLSAPGSPGACGGLGSLPGYLGKANMW